MNKIVLILNLLLLTTCLQAQIWIPSVFSDNMMFQRNDKVKIWGKANNNSNVCITFANQSKSVKADKNGNWVVYLDKMSANKIPQQLEISENGKLQKTISNILVGDVWILGGQSNMGLAVKFVDGYDDILKIADKYDNIRYFSQKVNGLSKTFADDVTNGKWSVCTRKSVGLYSGTGFYFAKNLYDNLDVPIGLLFTALGGSNMIAWTPEYAFEKLPIYKNRLNVFQSKMKTYNYDDAVKKWEIKMSEWEAKDKNKRPRWSPDKPNKISYLPERLTPTCLFNSSVAPLRNYTLKGVAWYQGESDSGLKNVQNFKNQYKLIVDSWRNTFNNKDMYFVNVQLPSYGRRNDGAWAEIRWEQYLATKELTNAYFAVTVDTGLERDVHPKEKPTVGKRLAYVTLKNVYKKDIVGEGNAFINIAFNGNSAKITIDDSKSKIVVDGKLRGFEVKINDNWEEADASLDGNLLTISAKHKDAKVLGVRYLWKNWAKPDVCIFNDQGLPSMPFLELL